MLNDFKAFISRGNVIDLAVAVVVGAAFTAIVNSFSADILGGILGAIGGKPDLSGAFILSVGDGEIRFGAFLTAVINFLIVAAAMFLVVKAITAAQSVNNKATDDAPAGPTELEVLEEIRDLLRSRT
jgi:large conductance mechanosensitive channel